MGNIKIPGGLTGYYVVDRQRSLHVDNFPKKVTQASVQELFEELLQSKGGNFLSRAGGTRRTSLVTYVLLRSEEDGKTHAWIEFSTEALADLALNLCKLHPESLKVGRTCLAVQRPKGYVTKAPTAAANGGVSLGSLNALNANGGQPPMDSPPMDLPSFANNVLQHSSPNTVGNTNNKDYVIDRKRALYAEGAPFDATGQEICRLFEGLLKVGGVEKTAGLVTHVIFARRCCAWVEFLSEEVADYALQQCHIHPESLKLGKNVLSVRRAYEVVRLLREEQENAVIPKGVFDWDYSVDRGRAVVAKNLPDNTSGPGIYHLFRNILLHSGKVDTSAVELVTHVIWQPGKSFALVEFGSDGLADLAYQLCKIKPDAVRLQQQRLLVERPAGPKPNGALSPAANGLDLGLHVTVVPPSPSGSLPSPVSGGLAQQLAQQGMGSPSPGGKKSALPRDIFSLSYSIDRQRALHVDALPDEEEGPGIRAMFEKLCLERGLTGGETGLTAAIAHIVRPPGRTFAWVEFNTAEIADTILDLFAQDLDTAKLGGPSGHRVIVQRPKGYKANSPSSKLSPGPLHSPSFDEDSFPSLPSSGKSESFLGSSLKSEASSFASAAAKRNGGVGFNGHMLPPAAFHPDAFPALRASHDLESSQNGDHKTGLPFGDDGFRLLSRHSSFSGRQASLAARARLDAFSSLTVPEATSSADVSGDDLFAAFNLHTAVDRLLEDSAFAKPARFIPAGAESGRHNGGPLHVGSGRTSGSASPAYGAISPPLGPIGPTTRPSSASSNQSAFGWGSESDVLTISALTLEPPANANPSPFSGASSEASPFASSYFNSPAFSAASPFSLTPRENPALSNAPALTRQLSGGSSNFSLYSSSPVESIWGAAGSSGGWSNFGGESNGHGMTGGRKGAFESVDRWGMAAGSFITG